MWPFKTPELFTCRSCGQMKPESEMLIVRSDDVTLKRGLCRDCVDNTTPSATNEASDEVLGALDVTDIVIRGAALLGSMSESEVTISPVDSSPSYESPSSDSSSSDSPSSDSSPEVSSDSGGSFDF